MSVLFIEYPKCSTCQKAKKWLLENNIAFDDRHIAEKNPSVKELQQWIVLSGKPVKSFFNTSGLVYKSLNLKDRLPQMSDFEKIDLLSTNGMLVKRPLLVGNDFVLVGFKESEWLEILKK